MQKIILYNTAETHSAGIILGRLMKAGDCIFLSGDLGAGKTTIAKGIAVGLGIKNEITSPTFTILNYYEGEKALCHFDLYRIEAYDELEDIGFDEYFYDSNMIKIMEWADKFPEISNQDGLYLYLEQNEGICTILVKASGDRYDNLLEEWGKNVNTSH